MGIIKGFFVVLSIAILSVNIPEPKPENELIHDDIFDEFIEDSLNEEQSEIFTDYFIQMLTQTCYYNDVDPWFVISTIQHESNFDPNAVAYDNKHFGLMQLSEKYHMERVESAGSDDIFNPEANVIAGILYIADLKEQCKYLNHSKYDTDTLTAAAYNKGFGYALELVNGTKDLTLHQETVVKDYRKYKKKYDKPITIPKNAIYIEKRHFK